MDCPMRVNEEIKVATLDCWLGRFLFWSTKIVFSSVELSSPIKWIKKKRELEHRIFRFFFTRELGSCKAAGSWKQLSCLCFLNFCSSVDFPFLFTYGMATGGHSVFPNRVSLSYFNYWELYVFVLGWPVHSSSCAEFSGSWWTGKFSQNQDTSKWPSENRRCIWRYIIPKGVMNVLLKISKSFRQLLFFFPRILVVPSVLGVIEMLINYNK